MKNGGYQILELNNSEILQWHNDNNQFEDSDLVDLNIKIPDKFEGDMDEYLNYLSNSEEVSKVILFKNLLLTRDNRVTFYSTLSKKPIYIVNTREDTGYERITTYYSKINDDWILYIRYDGKAIFLKVYKGAITQ